MLDFHCNKWIAGGDPAKVSGALCIADVALMAAALKKMYYLLLVYVRKKTKNAHVWSDQPQGAVESRSEPSTSC